MADIIDDANATADLFLALALRKTQQCAPVAKGIGMCLHCATVLADDRRWCDAQCRDDWEKEQRTCPRS